MQKIPKKVIDRISSKLKSYQAIALSHKEKDVSEADTVTLVKDILSDCFGFNKYEELTSEQQVKNTFVDLAVKIDGKIKFLIEVKASGVELNSSHLRQAVNYGSNLGIQWIVLTNGLEWQLHKVTFSPHIETEELSSFNLLNIDLKNEEVQMKLYLLCREGIDSDAMDEYNEHAQALNKFNIAQVILSESIISTIRRELRKLFPEIKMDSLQISDILNNEVLKREVIEDNKSKEAQKLIKRLTAKVNKQSGKIAPTGSVTGSQPTVP